MVFMISIPATDCGDRKARLTSEGNDTALPGPLSLLQIALRFALVYNIPRELQPNNKQSVCSVLWAGNRECGVNPQQLSLPYVIFD